MLAIRPADVSSACKRCMHASLYVCIYIYIHSDPKVDRIFFWRVRCGIHVGIMLDVGHFKKLVVGI
jgi:hypothetical protein